MSAVMDEGIKRWTARRKSALVLEIIQGKTTVAEASRQFDIPPAEIEDWIDQGKAGMENALRAKPEDVREQYGRQLKDLQEAYGEAMLELRARNELVPLPAEGEAHGRPVRLAVREATNWGRPWPTETVWPSWEAGSDMALSVGVMRIGQAAAGWWLHWSRCPHPAPMLGLRRHDRGSARP